MFTTLRVTEKETVAAFKRRFEMPVSSAVRVDPFAMFHSYRVLHKKDKEDSDHEILQMMYKSTRD